MSEEIIRVEGISFRYPNGEHNALSNVSFSINQGEWIAVIGPNGSGKSTMAKMLNGLLVPFAGKVHVKGMHLNDETVWDVRKTIGMVFQNPDNQFVGATVEDDVAFGLENNGIDREEMKERIQIALEQVRMLNFIKKEPARLSGGQKQRVAIAGIIALLPEVIILDEATAMLDPLGREEIINVVREIKEKYNLTVISITHDIDEANQADRIFVFQEGELRYQGNPESIFSVGDELINMGLDIPFTHKLKAALANKGVNVPKEYLNEEELIKWLSQSLLKM